MNNRLKEVGNINIYQNKSTLKYIILVISLLIGGASIYYTNLLVDDLKKREQELIQLYANTLEYVTNENNSENLVFIYQEIIVQNNSIPVISTDSLGNPLVSKNIDFPKKASEQEKQAILRKELEIMKEEHDPIKITTRVSTDEIYYIYYRNSKLLTQLKYYPYVQLSVIAVFAILAYLAFSYSKTAEQNRVWVGLAKETAHQLGTPLSSLMAWIEYFKADPRFQDTDIAGELDKDIRKLEMITSRFSNIGSVPVLKEENMKEVIHSTISYLQPRISTKVKIAIDAVAPDTRAMINKPLFDWVIENLCKNAVDAMKGSGAINIKIIKSREGKVYVDIADNGKGMTKSQVKKVFQPGFTTKKRGWGLGLTLVKRIIENYHKGKIFVKSSAIDQGTTFRIVLRT